MNKSPRHRSHIVALAITFTLATSGACLADKPPWAGNKGQSGKQQQKEQHGSSQGDKASSVQQQSGSSISVQFNFNDQQRHTIHNYYQEQYSAGHCPPGLAKKNNGCMPPGQAKKWQRGRPLPQDVIYHDLSPDLIVRLGPPPAGHRFVRVAADILLIAVGSGMVIDAIDDLSNM
jgi:Ni/Co efflux regulator RcnB